MRILNVFTRLGNRTKGGPQEEAMKISIQERDELDSSSAAITLWDAW